MKTKILASLLVTFLIFTSCSNDDDGDMIQETGDSKTYSLMSVSNPSISGMVTFSKNTNNTTTVKVDLNGTTSGMHPAHIHINTAAEGGAIAISLEPINGASGMSSTTFNKKDDGTPISYEELLDFNGYVNVHKSADDLGTLIAQGDIGQNELTETSKTYALASQSNPSIMGDAKFTKRVNGTTLIEVMLNGTTAGNMHPGHIHMNTAAEGGDIAVTFIPLDGATGVSKTQVAMLDDGSEITYEELLDYNGYVNIHKSADDLGTLIAQGDIGQNELTNASKTYALGSKSNPAIMGDATFTKRVNGTTLVEVMLEGTSAGDEHPGHIHMNTAAEGGDIAITFTPLDGARGMSKTQVAMLGDGTAITYEELLDFNGYINFHKSADDLGTLVAQGDIGQNELTNTSKTYTLGSKSNPAIMGDAKFTKRVNGTTLIEVMLEGTPANGEHPGHIHMNTAAEGGDIAVTFMPLNGTTGISMTQVGMLDDGTAITYDQLLEFDGYINIHKSATDLGTLIAQGDIGQNELTGDKKVYTLATVANSGVDGEATFYKRMNGEALLIIDVKGTMNGNSHPSHIHTGDINNPGAITVSLNPVDGNSGMSMTNIAKQDDDTVFGYDDVLTYNGYINVHKSATDLGTLLAQGNIGSN